MAPPDYHLLVEKDHLHLSRGPHENWSRPAVDPLFRSAALHYRRDAIGVILTGNLNDGTVGLYSIKQGGGVAIVQDPAEADAPSMPASALASVAVDYCLPLADIPAELIALVGEQRSNTIGQSGVRVMSKTEQQFDHPVCADLPRMRRGDARGNSGSGHAIPLPYPACDDGPGAGECAARNPGARYVGGAADDEERAELCRDLANKHRMRGDGEAAAQWLRAGQEAADREDAIRRVTGAERIRPERMAAAE